jgi:hypothetical protein
LIRKAQPVPIEAITTPATAGPTICPALKEVEFSATAFDKSASPTSSAMKVFAETGRHPLREPSWMLRLIAAVEAAKVPGGKKRD